MKIVQIVFVYVFIISFAYSQDDVKKYDHMVNFGGNALSYNTSKAETDVVSTSETLEITTSELNLNY